MNTDILFGKSKEHLVSLEGTKYFINTRMVQSFMELKRSAAEAGFDLQIASAYRDYERQLKIWNSKALGERPLLDDAGNLLNYSTLSPHQIVFSILRWSALPGASRHHWGSDIDIYDGRTQRAEEVKLEPAECVGNGPAARMHEWLDDQMAQGQAFGFYRPYKTDRGGVSPERWHISYEPVSRYYASYYTSSLFKKNILESDLQFKDVVLENIDEIYQRFFLNVDPP